MVREGKKYTSSLQLTSANIIQFALFIGPILQASNVLGKETLTYSARLLCFICQLGGYTNTCLSSDMKTETLFKKDERLKTFLKHHE